VVGRLSTAWVNAEAMKISDHSPRLWISSTKGWIITGRRISPVPSAAVTSATVSSVTRRVSCAEAPNSGFMTTARQRCRAITASSPSDVPASRITVGTVGTPAACRAGR